MQKIILTLGFVACFGFLFYNCKNAQTNGLQSDVDTTKVAQTPAPQKNNDIIQPPDTDYTGDYTDKYSNGIIKFSGFFRFGKRHGQWMAFYLNGEKWSECFYNKGLKDGASSVYFPNGQPQFTGWYKNDMKDSIWVFYDTIGKVIDTKRYKNDEEIVLKPQSK